MTFHSALKAVLMLLPVVLLTACPWDDTSAADEEKDPHFIRGKSRAGSMDFDGAIESFEKAIESNPRSAAAHFELGVLYEKKTDPAAAIYHFQKHLRLRPDSPLADVVRLRIDACKLELAKGFSYAFMSQQAQSEFDRLTSDNTRLKQQLEQLATQLATQSARLTNFPNPAPATNITLAPKTPSPTPNRPDNLTPKPQPLAPAALPQKPNPTRSYTVKRGDTLIAIARKFQVSLADLKKANPRLNPERVYPNQIVTIPARNN